MGKIIKTLVVLAVVIIAAVIAYTMILAPILERGWTN